MTTGKSKEPTSMRETLEKKTKGMLLALALFLAPVGPGHAISIHLEPATQTVAPGTLLSVSLEASGLGDLSAPSLGLWDVDIAFDPAILGFVGASFGTGLDLFGLGSINDAFDLGGLVDIFEVSLDLPSDLDTLQLGAFTLATLTFEALAVGSTPLTLTLDSVGDALGAPLAATASGAEVSVAVPEPGTLGLAGLGLAGLAWLRRRRAERTRPASLH
jgi:PEP-CTERM motif